MGGGRPVGSTGAVVVVAVVDEEAGGVGGLVGEGAACPTVVVGTESAEML